MCRDTQEQIRRETEEIYAQADYAGAREFVEGLSGQTLGTLRSALGEGSVEELVRRTVLGVGSPIIGTPDQVADGLQQLYEAGVDGVLFTFRHVREELEAFIEHVLPRLERRGVRRPYQGETHAHH